MKKLLILKMDFLDLFIKRTSEKYESEKSLIEEIEEQGEFRIIKVRLKNKGFTFRPGQLIMVSPVSGRTLLPVSSSPYRKNYLEITCDCKKSDLKKGGKILIRGPYGNGWPLEKMKNKNLILIAWETGITSVKSLIDFILPIRQKFGKITLLYGAETPSGLLYKNYLQTWMKIQDFKVLLTGQKKGKKWEGDGEPIQNLLSEVDDKNALSLVSEPEPMMKLACEILKGKHLKESDIFLWLKAEYVMGALQSYMGREVYPGGPVFSLKDLSKKR